MKRVLKIAIVMVIFIYIFSLRGASTDNLFGIYTFDTVSSLSPLSSYTKDYINEKMEGAQFVFQEDLFIVQTLTDSVEIKSPKYKKKAIDDNAEVFQKTSSDEAVKHQYIIYDKDGDRTNWRIYTSKKDVWISLIVDNTANNQELMIYRYKLIKSK